MSNSLDLDQAQRFVGPDLGQNCLQRLSADDKTPHNSPLMGKELIRYSHAVHTDDSDFANPDVQPSVTPAKHYPESVSRNFVCLFK